MKDADGNYRLLTTAERAEDRREINFQRQVNGQRYLTWDALLRKVDPRRRYRVQYSGVFDALSGEELLARAHTSQSILGCTVVVGTTQVEDDYVLPVSDMWETRRDPRTRRVMVANHLEDVWDITRFTEPVSPEEMPPDAGKVREAARTMADGKLRDLPSGDREEAEEAAAVAENAFIQYAARQHALGQRWEDDPWIGWARAQEAFDRAYGRARMRKAGVDIDQLPRWRSYQAFFELGVPPPSHEEMADHMIRNFGK